MLPLELGETERPPRALPPAVWPFPQKQNPSARNAL